MVNITKSNFLSTTTKTSSTSSTPTTSFFQNLSKASFLSLDLEMTGIFSSQRSYKHETPSERYDKIKEVPEKYNIIQVGVCIFVDNVKYLQLTKRSNLAQDSGGGNRTNNGSLNENNNASNNTETNDNQHHHEQQQGNNGNGDSDDENNSDTASNNNNNEEEEEEEVIPQYLCHKYNFYIFPPSPPPSPSHPYFFSSKEVTLNPSTISFLNRHNMDYNAWCKDGLPFVTLKEMEDIMKSFKERFGAKKEEEEEEKKEGAAEKKKRRDSRIELSRAEDIAFVARTMARLREWIDLPTPSPDNNNSNNEEDNGSNTQNISDNDDQEEEEGTSYLLPPCNSYLRRCLYETIESEYPTLICEPSKSHPNQILVLRLNPMEKELRIKAKQECEWNKIQKNYVGFTRIFKAISNVCCGREMMMMVDCMADLDKEEFWNDSFTEVKKEETKKKKKKKVPLIVHNGLMDLLFLTTHFISPTLPCSYEAAKEVISKHFPIVYDTKILSSECSDSAIQNGSTVLGDLYRVVREEEDGGLGLAGGELVSLVEETEEEKEEEQEHEAGYDAFMTGFVFVGLCRRIIRRALGDVNHREALCEALLASSSWNKEKDDEERNEGEDLLSVSKWLSNEMICQKVFGRNKLYLMSNLYTINLERQQPEHRHDNIVASSSSLSVVMEDALSRGMSLSTTYRISNVDPLSNTSIRDLDYVLMMLVDRHHNHPDTDEENESDYEEEEDGNSDSDDEGNDDDDDDDDDDDMAAIVVQNGIAPAVPQPAGADNNNNNNNVPPDNGIRVKYDLVRVDATTFIVATRFTSYDVMLPSQERDEEETLERHGKLIYRALRRHFPAYVEIVTMKEYLDMKKQEQEQQRKNANVATGSDSMENSNMLSLDEQYGVNGKETGSSSNGGGGVLQNVMSRIWNIVSSPSPSRKRRSDDGNNGMYDGNGKRQRSE